MGRYSLVPEDRELGWPDHSSSVGAVKGGLVGISSSPARSSPRNQGNEVTLHGCVQFGLGSPVRLTLNTGTVVSISKIVAHQRSEDAGRHLRCETSCLIWGPGWFAWCATTQWLRLTSRTREAHDHTHWCRWRYACSSGAIARQSCWFPSICQECTTSRWICCPEWVKHWIPSGRWPWSVYDPCLPSGASHRSTCLRHSPTVDSSSLYRRIRTPGPSGRMPSRCPGTTGGASCMCSRHSRWSFKFCRRSLSHQESGWFWSPLHWNRQLHGFRSWWIWHRKIQSRCSSRVKICWLKTFWLATGWRKLRHYRPSNIHTWKLYRPSWGLRAIPGKLLTWCQGSFVTHRSKCMNPIGQDSCPSVGRKKMARVSSQKSSFQHLYDASVQRRTSPSDNNFTSHVCGFCVMSLGLRSSSRSTHQATHQSFQARMSSATQNYAQVGPSSCTFIFIETAVSIRMGCSRGILWWHHSLKMADHVNCVPASIGFGETALISTRIECRGRQVCVLERSHPATTCGISFAGSLRRINFRHKLRNGSPYRGLPISSRLKRRGCCVLSDSWSSTYGTRKESGGPSTDVCSLESQHQRYHEKSHQPMNRGDCQGSLHTSWSRVWPSYCTWGQSTVSIMGV